MIFTLSSYAQKTVSQLKIEPEIVDMGMIKEENGIVKAIFKITNISKRPYIMNYNFSSCGCLSSKISKEPLMPGASREVVVEYDPKRRPGIFNKEVVLVSDNKKHGDPLRVMGEVLPRAKSIAELYPIKSLFGVQLSDDKFPFGIISQNEKHTAVINLLNNSKSVVDLRVVTQGDALGKATLTTSKLEPRREAQLHFTYNLVGNRRYGELKNQIELYVNGKKWDQVIDINALAIYNFFDISDSERREAPRAIVSPLVYKTGTVKVPILNNGRTNLEILEVITSDKSVKYSLPKRIIAPNESVDITISSSTECSVTMLMNSPDTPVVVIKLKN